MFILRDARDSSTHQNKLGMKRIEQEVVLLMFIIMNAITMSDQTQI